MASQTATMVPPAPKMSTQQNNYNIQKNAPKNEMNKKNTSKPKFGVYEDQADEINKPIVQTRSRSKEIVNIADQDKENKKRSKPKSKTKKKTKFQLITEDGQNNLAQHAFMLREHCTLAPRALVIPMNLQIDCTATELNSSTLNGKTIVRKVLRLQDMIENCKELRSQIVSRIRSEYVPPESEMIEEGVPQEVIDMYDRVINSFSLQAASLSDFNVVRENMDPTSMKRNAFFNIGASWCTPVVDIVSTPLDRYFIDPTTRMKYKQFLNIGDSHHIVGSQIQQMKYHLGSPTPVQSYQYLVHPSCLTRAPILSPEITMEDIHENPYLMGSCGKTDHYFDITTKCLREDSEVFVSDLLLHGKKITNQSLFPNKKKPEMHVSQDYDPAQDMWKQNKTVFLDNLSYPGTFFRSFDEGVTATGIGLGKAVQVPLRDYFAYTYRLGDKIDETRCTSFKHGHIGWSFEDLLPNSPVVKLYCTLTLTILPIIPNHDSTYVRYLNATKYLWQNTKQYNG